MASSLHLRVTANNLDDAELVESLAATAHAYGIHDDLADALHKSRGHVHPHPERWAEQAEDAWNAELWPAIKEACDIVGEGVPVLAKARKRGALDWANEVLLESVADLVRDAISGRLGVLSPIARQRWMALGILLPDNQLNPALSILLQGGWLAGTGQISSQATLNQLRLAVARVAWTNGSRLASQWINQQGGQYVRWFATRVGEHANTQMHTWQAQAIGRMVSDYNEGKLKPTDNEGTVLEDRAPIQTWQQLKTELYHRFENTSEIDHDWHRIAATESRLAANAGRLLGMQEDGVEYITMRVHKDACKGCKTLYLESDGTPKKFKLTTILDNFWQTGGLNIGRKQSAIGTDGGWLPVGGVTHPWCRCVPVRSRD